MSLNVLVSHYGSHGSYLQTCLPFISTHTWTATTHHPQQEREGVKKKKKKTEQEEREKSNGRVDEKGQWSRRKRWIMARPQDWNKSPVDDSIMCSHRGAVHCRLLCNLLKSHSVRTQPMKWEFNYVYHCLIDIITEKDFRRESDPLRNHLASHGAGHVTVLRIYCYRDFSKDYLKSSPIRLLPIDNDLLLIIEIIKNLIKMLN